jgi:hypothetical protein
VHRSFFRRFPLGDRMTVALNSCLLFVVLFYVYPLKFLARGLAAMFFGRGVGVRLGMPGWIYALIGPLCGAHGYWNARRSARAAVE